MLSRGTQLAKVFFECANFFNVCLFLAEFEGDCTNRGEDFSCLENLPFEGKNFVDLQKIGWEWGIKDKSVKKMAGLILGIRISKTQQLSNWEADKLSPAQQLYAATDAWVCREMYLKLLQTAKNPLKLDEQGNIKER